MKCGIIPKLGSLAFYLLQQLQVERFNRDRRQLQGGSRPVNFDDIYESGFLPALQSLDLNGTFVWVDRGGDYPLYNLEVGIVWVSFLRLCQTDVKLRSPGSNYGSL